MKKAISVTAGIVFRFTRRRCYRALTVALAGLSCFISCAVRPKDRSTKWYFMMTLTSSTTLYVHFVKHVCGLIKCKRYILCFPTFLARDSIYAERAICYRPSACPSFCLSHGWITISQKRLKLGSCNFHHRVAQSL